MSETVEKKKRGGRKQINLKPRAQHEWLPGKYKSPEALQAAIDVFWGIIAESGRPATITRLAAVLGLCREELCQYANKDLYGPIVLAARQRIVWEWEERLAGAHCSGPIFWLKNCAGWRDEQQIKQESDISIVIRLAGGRAVENGCDGL